MNLKEKLKTELKPLYDELIKDAYSAGHCIFCMEWGKKFPQEKNERILFVGRSNNGWTDPLDIWDDENQVTAENIFNDDENYLFAHVDQMKWVEDKWNNREGYNTHKSSFWRVIKDITKAFYPQEDWYNYVAWSNLYKVVPQGGNPTKGSRDEQLESCQKILQKEIEVLSPKYVVFLTGWDWAKDFVSYLNGNKEPEKSESIQWSDDYSADVYRIKDTTCIVSEHPEGKKEANHIGAIIALISGKFKPVTDVLKKHFGNKLLIGYKPKYIQLYFENYQYWLELWYYPDKIYLYLCSETDCEGTTKGGLQFLRNPQEDTNGFCYYTSDKALSFDISETDKMLNEAVIPILKDLSQG